jgi:hypothetical protein
MRNQLQANIGLARITAAIALTIRACGTHTTSGAAVQAHKSPETASTPTGCPRPPEPPKPVPVNNLGKFTLSDLHPGDRLTKQALDNGEFTAFRQVKNRAKTNDSLVGLFVQNVAIFETAAFQNAFARRPGLPARRHSCGSADHPRPDGGLVPG